MPAEHSVLTLTVIGKGGQEGPAYELPLEDGAEYALGRADGELVFDDEPEMSPRHALLRAEPGGVLLEDLGSRNGIFLRLREPTPLKDGAWFFAGEQLLRYERYHAPDLRADARGITFSGTPLKAWSFRLVQTLHEGRPGAAWVADGMQATIGREQGTLQFPWDRFMSREHCRVQHDGDAAWLYDLKSRNGTYLRLDAPHRLQDGDYFFTGRKLFRATLA